MNRKHLVLWDGECDFCRRCVEWLGARDRFGALEFAPFQDVALSPDLRAACTKAIHVVKANGDLLHAGRAVMFLGRFTKWNRLARIGEWPVFLPFIEIGYALVARNRPFFSKLSARFGL